MISFKHLLSLMLLTATLLCVACEPEKPSQPSGRKYVSAFPYLESSQEELKKIPYPVEFTIARNLDEELGDIEAGHCPPPPSEPVYDLEFSHVYRRDDETHSEVDEEARELYIEQTRDIRVFEAELISLTNAALESDIYGKEYARCALSWMGEWANKEAYLGDSNYAGDYIRQWALGVLSNAYLQIRYVLGETGEPGRKVEKWLTDIASLNIATIEASPELTHNHNNHLYWAAWGITNAGVALDNKSFLNWGINKIKYVLETEIAEDYTLPLEMARGKKALHYHNFAMTPLIMIAETALANGYDLYEINKGILGKLVAKVFEGLKEPEIFGELAEVKQESLEDISTGHYAWLEIYNKRFPSQEIEDFLQPLRPILSKRVGGDITALFLIDTYKPVDGEEDSFMADPVEIELQETMDELIESGQVWIF